MTDQGKWHFIGIGGVGMSGIAKICLEMGKRVSGSDLAESDLTKGLEALGAEIHIGHDAAYVTPELETVVVSTAIHRENPELCRARELGIPVMHRGAALARLMDKKRGIAVAGAHGKTTTSAMIALLLEKGGYDPAFLVGAYVEDLGTNGKWGKGEYMAAEADESDGSFLLLNPLVALVTNVEDDHLDYYGSQDRINEAFIEFVNHVPAQGAAIVCIDDPGIRGLLPCFRSRRLLTYGTSPEAWLRGENLRCQGDRMQAEVYLEDRLLGTLKLSVYGNHNLLNALGAIAAALVWGMDFETAASILEGFHGAHRRLERVGEAKGVRVFDDYAHHPTELKATLKAAAMIEARRRIIVFQPHRYTRTKLLAKEFGDAFQGADQFYLLPIYSAGEKPIPGVTSRLIAEAVEAAGGFQPKLAADFAEALTLLQREVEAGDLVLTLGAGDVWRLGPQLLEALKEE